MNQQTLFPRNMHTIKPILPGTARLIAATLTILAAVIHSVPSVLAQTLNAVKIVDGLQKGNVDTMSTYYTITVGSGFDPTLVYHNLKFKVRRTSLPYDSNYDHDDAFDDAVFNINHCHPVERKFVC